jgi:uncharacterized alkaline shock family protein YloU
MNIFNKIMVVLVLIFLVCLSIISMVNVFAGYFKWSDLALKIFNPGYNVSKFVAFLALLAVLAISVLLILLEFYRRRAKVANISSSKTGNAMVTLETVAMQIKNEVLKVDGLEEIKIKIIPKTTGIIIDMNAKLNEGVDIPEKMQEIINGATGIVSDKLGIKVIKTNLTIIGLVAGRKEKEPQKKEVEEKAAEAALAEDKDIIETENDDDNPG